MCGIFGTFGFSDRTLMKRMDAAMTHRGPDDHGYFLDDNVAIGSRRLSIIDISGGRQPIHNEDSSLWIAYNGEAYNFRELRMALEKKHRFYTNTDTEVLLHAYEEYGLGFIDKVNGMFAFAIWDSRKKTLILGRDRIGIKPLYYLTDGQRLVFASEIKSILQYPFTREVDQTALYRFLVLKYVPGDITMFRGVRKLLPGHVLICSRDGFRTEKYWDADIMPAEMSLEVCSQRLGEMLRKSVEMRLISDVPVGAFLSGGLDSSIITGIMSEVSDKVKTFSVGFDVQEYNELEFARMASEHFGTDSHEVILDPEKFLRILPKVVWHFDEPNSDPAAIPTFYISELARKNVKVILTGEGADELFGGYAKYNVQRRETMSQHYMKLPGGLRGLAGRVLPEKYASYLRAAEKTRRTYLTPNVSYSERLERHATAKGLAEDMNRVFDGHVRSHDRLTEMSYIDLKTWLPEEILMKTDKMTMANSIEARVPFLDHNIAEFALSMPPRFRISGNVHKFILRHAFRDMLPPRIRDRGKWGFNVPLPLWQKDLVRDMEEEVSSSDIVRKHVDSAYVRKCTKPKNMQFFFNLVILKKWSDIFIEGDGSIPA